MTDRPEGANLQKQEFAHPNAPPGQCHTEEVSPLVTPTTPNPLPGVTTQTYHPLPHMAAHTEAL